MSESTFVLACSMLLNIGMMWQIYISNTWLDRTHAMCSLLLDRCKQILDDGDEWREMLYECQGEILRRDVNEEASEL